MRGALKEPAKRKAMQQEQFSYNVSKWEGGKMGPKELISTKAVQTSVKTKAFLFLRTVLHNYMSICVVERLNIETC